MVASITHHKKDNTVFLELLQKDGHVRNFQAQLKHKDGPIWWASTNAHFYMDKADTIRGVEGVDRNVDELKKAEKAQQRSSPSTYTYIPNLLLLKSTRGNSSRYS
jgi:hypothetical protein